MIAIVLQLFLLVNNVVFINERIIPLIIRVRLRLSKLKNLQRYTIPISFAANQIKELVVMSRFAKKVRFSDKN
jgi:hypothetical protein